MKETTGKTTIAYKKLGAKGKCPDIKKLASLYSKMTADEIAREYGVSKHTVRSWIYKYRKGANV